MRVLTHPLADGDKFSLKPTGEGLTLPGRPASLHIRLLETLRERSLTTFSKPMLRIRLQRFGTKNEPTYRLVVAEQAIRRDGRFVEVLGNYNPRARGKTPGLVINVERVDHWVKLGAQPSDTAKSLVKRAREEAAKA